MRTPSGLYISDSGALIRPAASRRSLTSPCSPSSTIHEKVRTMMLVKYGSTIDNTTTLTPMPEELARCDRGGDRIDDGFFAVTLGQPAQLDGAAIRPGDRRGRRQSGHHCRRAASLR